MAPYATGPGWELLHGDCIEAMRGMAEASVDAIVCDPPYDLTGVSRNGSPRQNDPATPYGRTRLGGGFMGKTWDATGVAFDPATWAEALRVLKPGGHLLATGGTRTYHRLACAIEDAGFEMRDQLQWLYGSGFPKSRSLRDIDRPELGTALKPAHEPICLARKPLAEGNVAANVLAWGTGGINVDACRIESGQPRNPNFRNPSSSGIWGGSDNGNLVGYQSPPRRWPANVCLSHSPECEQVGTRRVKSGVWGANQNTEPGNGGTMGKGWAHQPSRDAGIAAPDGTEQVEAWNCAPGCAVRLLDEQAGVRPVSGAARNGRPATAPMTGMFLGGQGYSGNGTLHNDTGGASRFFYCAKASRSERNAGLEGMPQAVRHTLVGGTRPSRADGERRNEHTPAAPQSNSHPTVKPIALMRWLCRLITPPGGLILDPFTGSGSTGLAAIAEGFRFIGIEKEAEYCQIIEARLNATSPLKAAA